MNSRWYFSIFIIVLALLGGVVNQQQITEPNQEIVLQFNNADVKPADIHKTIAYVKEQLKAVVAGQLKVTEHANGKLTISYYSETNVASIKALLLEDEALQLAIESKNIGGDTNGLPSDNPKTPYNLDIYEIEDGQGTDSGLGGNPALIVEAKTDRVSNFKEHLSISYVVSKNSETILNSAYKSYCNIAIVIDTSTKKIPETRAGPIA